jgi:tetratricopeptide (TPR) repeat protein
VVSVGWTVPERSTRGYSIPECRLLPHSQACFRQIVKEVASSCLAVNGGNDEDINKGEEQETVLDAMNFLGDLYTDQGKLGEAEQSYERAPRGYEEAIGSNLIQQHRPALNTLENMGDVCALQAEIAKAQAIYARALCGLSSVLGRSSEKCMNLAVKINCLAPSSGE